jgi:ribosomal protein S18 acetylase RimI-like enzyme
MTSVRPITEADIPGFHAALDAVARESGFLRGNRAPPLDDVGRFVLDNIRNRNPQFVAVSDAGGVVGWCDIVRGRGDHESHSGELGMGVMGPWRGTGIGRQLLVETVASADAEEILRIELSVHSDNLRAISLYRRFGFVEEGRKRKARLKSSVPVDVLLMARLRPEGEWP